MSRQGRHTTQEAFGRGITKVVSHFNFCEWNAMSQIYYLKEFKEGKAAATDTETPLHIEGVPVDVLFEEAYRLARKQSAAKDLRIRFEVIAWEPLVAAADSRMLWESLRAITYFILSVAKGGEIVLRVFPSHNDTCITFEATASEAIGDGEWDESELATAKARVARMGGELHLFRHSDGSVQVRFWIPQWIHCELDDLSQYRRAA
jgi:hypothetical protein